MAVGTAAVVPYLALPQGQATPTGGVQVLGAKPADKANIALASVAKTFVGELIETARMVAEERGEHGALLPAHIHTAYQQLQQQNKVPPKAKRRRRML